MADPKKASSALFLLLWLVDACLGVRQVHYIHWNISNPMFRIDNTDHIIDINRGNQPWEYDQVNIICPLYRRGDAKERSQMEQYIIYSVSKEEYDSCRIMTPNPRVVAQCNRPHELMYFTISFRSFHPIPGMMEFQPGEDYYFISTSSPTDLRRRVGGRCSTHNMKVQFKVADNEHEKREGEVEGSSQSRHAINVPRGKGRPTTASSTTSTTSPPPTQLRDAYRYGKLPRFYGDLSYYPYDGDDDGGGGYGDRDVNRRGYGGVHPNDVYSKRDAARAAAAMASASSASRQKISSASITFFSTAAVLFSLRRTL